MNTRPEFTLMGRNEATTFRGLCGTHDNALFRPIEAGPVQTENVEHLFLLAYRSILKEMYEKQRTLAFTTEATDKLSPHDDPQPGDPLYLAFASAVEDTYSFAQIKWAFDDLYLSGRFNTLGNLVISLPKVRRVLAVSSIFGPHADIQDPADPISSRRCVPYSVLPIADHTEAVFSWLPQHAEYAAGVLAPFSHAEGYYLGYLLSKLILKQSENFVISPRHFNAFSDQKKETILRLFTATVFEDFESEELYLL